MLQIFFNTIAPRVGKIAMIAAMTMFLANTINAQTKDCDTNAKITQSEIDDIPTFDELLELFLSYYQATDSIRKNIADILRVNHALFMEAGSYYHSQGNFDRAADFFEAHWNIPSLSTFAGQKDVFVFDSVFQIVKHLAATSALQAGDYRRAISMTYRILREPFIENSELTESDIFELLASAYQQMGNNARFSATIRAGAARFPTNEFFFLNLLYELILSGDTQGALAYIDRTVVANPSFSCKLISVRGSLLAEKGDFEGAKMEFRRALAIDAYCEEALNALARHYMVRAQDLREVSFSLPRIERIEADKQILELYQAALPLLETLDEVMKGRNASERDVLSVLLLLRNVYHNLSLLGVDKSVQFLEIERRLPENFW